MSGEHGEGGSFVSQMCVDTGKLLLLLLWWRWQRWCCWSAAAERHRLAGGRVGRAEGGGGRGRKRFDLDAGKMVFVSLLSCSYKVLRELKANKINWY